MNKTTAKNILSCSIGHAVSLTIKTPNGFEYIKIGKLNRVSDEGCFLRDDTESIQFSDIIMIHFTRSNITFD